MNTSSPAAKSPYEHTTIGEFFPPSGSYPSSSGWPDDISPTHCIQPTAITMRFITKLLPLITLAVHVAGTDLESGTDSARAGGLGSSIELPTLTEPRPVVLRFESVDAAFQLALERGVLQEDTIVVAEPHQQGIQRPTPSDSELRKAWAEVKEIVKMPGMILIGTVEIISDSMKRHPWWWFGGACVVSGVVSGVVAYHQIHDKHEICPGSHSGDLDCVKISRRGNVQYTSQDGTPTSLPSCASLNPHAGNSPRITGKSRMEHRRRLSIEEDAA
ncbi:hypothetical protein FB446DRAFT_747312 [Lentinula raphanica]|nr:hypothetical protein FB446DRAFT_747312 [Lentinula raphanica]